MYIFPITKEEIVDTRAIKNSKSMDHRDVFVFITKIIILKRSVNLML